MKTAIAILKEVGFSFFLPDCPTFGTIPPESVKFGRDHFTPHFRDVFIGEAQGGFYITSHIIGDYRLYRCRTVYYNTKVANIFAMGGMPEEAARKFVDNFKAKRYTSQ